MVHVLCNYRYMHRYHACLGYFKYIVYVNDHCFDHHRYEVFHTDQMDIVKNYPTMVKAEMKNYDEGVCKFFEVGRNQPVSFLLLFWNDQANIFYLLVIQTHEYINLFVEIFTIYKILFLLEEKQIQDSCS